MPSSFLVNNFHHWRARAEEARALVNRIDDAEAKRTMIGIAASYDRLAGIAEIRAGASSPPVS